MKKLKKKEYEVTEGVKLFIVKKNIVWKNIDVVIVGVVIVIVK